MTEKVKEEQAVYGEELPYGTDPTELFADRTIRDKTIIHNNKRWKFQYRELTWEQIGTVSSAASGMEDVRGQTVVTFDIAKYNRLYLKETLVKAAFPLNLAFYKSLSSDFGRKIAEAFVEMPALGELESKNLSEPSTEDGQTTQPQE